MPYPGVSIRFIYGFYVRKSRGELEMIVVVVALRALGILCSKKMLLRFFSGGYCCCCGGSEMILYLE